MTEKYHARPAGEVTSEQLERDAEVIDAIGLRLARLANADPMQVGRIPERLGKTGILPAGRDASLRAGAAAVREGGGR